MPSRTAAKRGGVDPFRMKGAVQLAWRYVLRHGGRTGLLVLALGLALALPLAVRLLLQMARQEMVARAEATPLVLGAKGSPLELTLSSLYFGRRGLDAMEQRAVQEIRATGLAEAVPLHVRHHAQGAPVVGTTLEYFAFRGLSIARGRQMGRLGDCVVGAELARVRGLQPGGKVSTSPEQVFDLAGVYPLRMTVTGVLAKTGTADDHAVFVDVKTAWLIEGRAHGHEDLVQSQDPQAVLSRTGDNVVGSKAVRMYTEVTDGNLASFHFHGDIEKYPLTAVLVLPRDDKSRAILLGRHQQRGGAWQMVEPVREVESLLATLVQAERFAMVLLVLLGVAVSAIALLVFALSFKMRRREFETLQHLGISQGILVMVKASEVLLVAMLAAGVAGALLLAVGCLGPGWVRLGLN